jgi:hypothetical protein
MRESAPSTPHRDHGTTSFHPEATRPPAPYVVSSPSRPESRAPPGPSLRMVRPAFARARPPVGADQRAPVLDVAPMPPGGWLRPQSLLSCPDGGAVVRVTSPGSPGVGVCAGAPTVWAPGQDTPARESSPAGMTLTPGESLVPGDCFSLYPGDRLLQQRMLQYCRLL